MKISKVEVHPLGSRLHQPLRWGAMSIDTKGGVVVRVLTDEGVVGIGEAGLSVEFFDRVSPIITSQLASLLVGQDPLDIGALWERMYTATHQWGRRGLETYAISGIDIALWDILGKVTGMPIHRLLGATKSSIPVYYAPSLKPPDQIIDECRQMVEDGARAIKLRAGLGLEVDQQLVAATRRTVGDQVTLMVDANMSYDRHDAQTAAKSFEQQQVSWLEEPIRAPSLAQYADEHRWLAERVDLRLAGGESMFTRYEYANLLRPRVFDILQPDCTCVGGITEAKRIADTASTFNIDCVPHVACSSGTGIGLAAALHVVLACSNTPLLEFDAYGGPGWNGLLIEPIQVNDGHVAAPEAPGLGIDLNPDAVEKFRLGTREEVTLQ